MADFGGIITVITAIIALISTAIASIMTYIFNRKLKDMEQRSTEKLQNLNQAHQQKLADTNNRFQAELEVLKKQLESQKSEQDARRNYEYEAKKRLYEQSGPILFQFVETSELALNRITGIAGSIRHGSLEPYSGWLSNTDSYYLKNTIYGVMAPMAAFRLLQSQLTLVDLSLYSYIGIQYEVAKGVYRTFSDDYALAGSG
jgi:multidrug efflux pump subunit AcrA (membrane-fusion protein)